MKLTRSAYARVKVTIRAGGTVTELCLCHQSAVIVAKLACWGKVQLAEKDLAYLLSWLKNELTEPVRN